MTIRDDWPRMKACRDCRWFCAAPGHPGGPFCAHPAVCDTEVDYVNGTRRKVLAPVVHARYWRQNPVGCQGKCGEEARHWEPKPPSRWQRLVRRLSRRWTVLDG